VIIGDKNEAAFIAKILSCESGDEIIKFLSSFTALKESIKTA
jgi:hypothetical protein